MKSIFLAVLFGVASFSSLSAKAQVSLNISVGTRLYHHAAPARRTYIYVKPQRTYTVPYVRYAPASQRRVVVVRERGHRLEHHYFRWDENRRDYHHGRH